MAELLLARAMPGFDSSRSLDRRRRTSALSLAISAAIHACFVVIAGALVWRTSLEPKELGAAHVIFDAPGASAGTAEAGESSGSAALNTLTSAGSLNPVLASVSGSVEQHPLEGLSSTSINTRSPGSTGVQRESAISAASGFASPDGSISSMFGGTGSGSSNTLPSGSAVAGLGGPGGKKSSVLFGGLGASNVGSVVYVVDCSGPMVTSLPMVIRELERSIGALSNGQRFGVVIFRKMDANAVGAESFAPVLVRATPSARDLVIEWLNQVVPSGKSSPMEGLQLGLQLKPDAIFLLSRSIQRSGGGVWELGQHDTLTRLETLNPQVGKPQPSTTSRRQTLIQTIQFLDEDPTGTMQAIGKLHGGGTGYRVVKRQNELESSQATAP